jgi:hypothetical protein
VWQGIDGSAASTPNTGFGSPGVFTFTGVAGTSSSTGFSRDATTGSITWSVPTPSFTLGNVVSATATTPSWAVTIIPGFKGLVPHVATTPEIKWVALDGADETFGIPHTIKVEVFARYSCKVRVRPQTINLTKNRGTKNVGEPVVIDATIHSNKEGGALADIPAVFAFVMKPDGVIEDGIQMTKNKIGKYSAVYTPQVSGSFTVRVQDVSPEFISEEEFLVAQDFIRV